MHYCTRMIIIYIHLPRHWLRKRVDYRGWMMTNRSNRMCVCIDMHHIRRIEILKYNIIIIILRKYI